MTYNQIQDESLRLWSLWRVSENDEEVIDLMIHISNLKDSMEDLVKYTLYCQQLQHLKSEYVRQEKVKQINVSLKQKKPSKPVIVSIPPPQKEEKKQFTKRCWWNDGENEYLDYAPPNSRCEKGRLRK